MLRVLVLGGGGMLGHKVFQVLSKRFDTFATFRDFVRYPMYEGVHGTCTIVDVDAMAFRTVAGAFAQTEPDVVINCIGITKHREAVKDPLICIGVNSLFPHLLSDLCAKTGTRLFHISTDCVFSGRKGFYTEEDIPDPEDLYGRTKLLGEVARKRCLTVRVSLFGRDFTSQGGFLEWFLSNRGGKVRGYVNAIYTGFPTQVLARIIGDLIADFPDLSGLYHVSSASISKCDLLVKVRDAMELDIEVEPYEDFYCDRSLDSTRFWAEVGYPIPSWDSMIAQLVKDDTPYDEWWETAQ